MVGPRKQPFAIHKHIVAKIPLLRQKFLEDRESMEARTGSMVMAEVDTVAFAVAVDFAYKGRLDEEGVKGRYAKEDDEDSEEDEIKVVETDEDEDVLKAWSVRRGDDAENAKTTSSRKSTTKSSPSTHSENNDDHDIPSEDEESKPPISEPDAEPEDEDSILPTYDNLLTTIFELSHALHYEALANATVSAYHNILLSDPPSAWSLLYLQRKGLQDSKMFKMMLRCIAHTIRTAEEEEGGWEGHGFVDGWMEENVQNGKMVVRAMAELARDEGAWGSEDVCKKWHWHEDGRRCGGGKGRKREGEGECARGVGGGKGIGKLGRPKKVRKV